MNQTKRENEKIRRQQEQKDKKGKTKRRKGKSCFKATQKFAMFLSYYS